MVDEDTPTAINLLVYCSKKVAKRKDGSNYENKKKMKNILNYITLGSSSSL